MISVTVLYFASLREDTGMNQQTVTLDVSDTPRHLFEKISRQHKFSLPASQLRVAVNGQFADWARRLDADDQVAFLPPMSGG